MPSCPIYVGSAAVSMINSGWDTFMNRATDAYTLARDLTVDLTQFQIDPVSFNYTFEPPGNPAGFVAPTPPADPDIVYDPSGFTDPGDVPNTGVPQVNFDSWPQFGVNTDFTPTAARPAVSEPTPDYGLAPTTSTYTLPVYVPFTNPELPTLLPVILPTLPAINFPQFTATAPIVDFTAPSGNIVFNPTPYASTELDLLRATISIMLNGNLGLPPAVVAALHARARIREDLTAAKAIQEAFEDYAARGYSMPPGALNQRIMEVRQNNQNQANSLSRDIYIQDQGEILKSLREAVTTGVALEGHLMDNYMHLQDLQLQTQKAMVDANVSIFNALVNLFNAKQQAYGIAAQVFRDRIQAELAKVEVYKAQLEGQRLISELNKDQIAIYESQIRAANLLIEQYKAQLEGVRIQTDIDKNKIEIFRARVEAFGEEVKAYATVWDAYKAEVEADSTRARIIESQVNAYGAQVRAASDKATSQIARANLTLESEKTQMLGWRGKLDRFIAEVDAEAKRIQAGVSIFEGKARIYAAAGQVAASESDADTRAFQAVVEAGRAAKEIGLQNAKTHIEQVVQIATIMAGQLKAAAQTSAELAASAMSAIHFGAQASDSSGTSSSTGCVTSYNYTGSL